MYPNIQLAFRNDSTQWWSIFLLPTILIIHSFLDAQNDQLKCFTFLSTVPTLLSYRYNRNFLSFTVLNICFNLVLYLYFGSFTALVFLIISNILAFVILYSLSAVFTRCFTFVEFIVIFQPIFYYFIRIIQFNFSKLNFEIYPLLDKSESYLICLTFYSTLIIALILFQFSYEIQSTLLKIFIYFILLPCLTYYYMWKILFQEPIIWLLQFIFADEIRKLLFGVWFSILLITSIFALNHTYSNGSTTTVTRKLFHLSISIVYLIGIKNDVIFLEFSSKLVLFALLYIEIIRLSKIYMVSKIIEDVFESFRDEKDLGIFTLTHIYLLVGCSAPLWLPNDIVNEPKLLLASGVITVGIGDTFASIGGFFFGKHKWPNSKKTYEGTVCSFISQIFALIVLQSYFKSPFSFETLPILTLLKFLIISLSSALVETFTIHIDNLILPLIQYIIYLLLLKY